jgi:hypothetical protein
VAVNDLSGIQPQENCFFLVYLWASKSKIRFNEVFEEEQTINQTKQNKTKQSKTN